MSAEAQQVRRADAPPLEVIDGGRAPARPDRRPVVAEILSDGTIRAVAGGSSPDGDGFVVGQLSGDGWTLWWERRRW